MTHPTPNQELKACPFCKCDAVRFGDYFTLKHKPDCFLSYATIVSINHSEQWNTRHLDDSTRRKLEPDKETRERKLREALLEFVRVERGFGHHGQHPDNECADCKRVRMAGEALSNGYIVSLTQPERKENE